MEGKYGDLTNGAKRDHARSVQSRLDAALDQYSFTHNNKLLEDSPNKSELNQFGDFSGSHSQYDHSESLERGMAAEMEKSTDFSFRSKSALPPVSTISSISSHAEGPRKARSDNGHRSSSVTRFSPMPTRKVTALGVPESGSEYSPSKYHQTLRTPYGASRAQPRSMRKPSPKSFKDTTTLFRELGLEDSVQNPQQTAPAPSKSFHMTRNPLPADLTVLVEKTRQTVLEAINSIAITKDNRNLFVAIDHLQKTVQALEEQQPESETQVINLQNELQQARDAFKAEQQRAQFAENELKQHLQQKTSVSANDTQLKVLETRNTSLANALSSVKKDLENRTLELEVAREEIAGADEEHNDAIRRLADAQTTIENLNAEIVILKKQVAVLTDDLAKARNDTNKNIKATGTERRKKLPSPASSNVSTKSQRKTSRGSSDEEIEVSKSILNDSDIDELTREIQETRQRNKKLAANSAPPSKHHSGKHKAQPKPTNGHSKQRSGASKEPALASRSLRSVHKNQKLPKPVLELSEDETSHYDPGFDDTELSTALESSEEETDASESIDEDAPSRILYRRRPRHQVSGRHTVATKVNVEKIINDLSKHETAKCTICARKALERKTHHDHNARTYLSQPHGLGQDPTGDDGNATIRPSQPPVPALHSVLLGLEDEYRHLQMKYDGLANEYKGVDPSLGKKKRKILAADVRNMIESLEVKADQIYAIYDVLEAARTGMSWAASEQAPRVKTETRSSPTAWMPT